MLTALCRVRLVFLFKNRGCGEKARKKAMKYGENFAREWLARYQSANGSLWVEELNLNVMLLISGGRFRFMVTRMYRNDPLISSILAEN